MTDMATRLELGYVGDGVRLDPIRLTVVAQTPTGPVWLNEGMGHLEESSRAPHSCDQSR
jgi:hypothetical protein